MPPFTNGKFAAFRKIIKFRGSSHSFAANRAHRRVQLHEGSSEVKDETASAVMLAALKRRR